MSKLPRAALEDEAIRRSQKVRWDEAAPLFIRAADVLRGLRDRGPALDLQETFLLRMALYNEACAYAKTGRPDRASR